MIQIETGRINFSSLEPAWRVAKHTHPVDVLGNLILVKAERAPETIRREARPEVAEPFVYMVPV